MTIEKGMFGLTILSLVIAAVLVTAASAQPEAVKFVSAKPLFLKLAMGGGEQAPVVAVGFDESKGTGSGYDLVYIDTNGNGVLEATEKYAAESGAGAANFNVNLPATLFPAPVGEGIEKAVAARFLVYSLGNLNPSVMVNLNLRLTQGDQVWNYSLSSSGATPAGSLKEAPVLHAGPLQIVPTVRPGASCGIAARLQANDFSLNCAGPAGAISNVTIRIQSAGGQVAHQETVPLGRLGFG